MNYLVQIRKDEVNLRSFMLRILPLAFLLLFAASAVSAEEKEKKAAAVTREVLVKIRAIKASDPYDEESSPTKPSSIEPTIADLTPKLANLHFRTFKLISDDEISLNLKKKQTIELTERTVLHLRPLYIDGDRIGMWIKWTDVSGKQVLLDTRMYFDPEESMVTGTNCKEGKGVILAINVKAK